MCGFAGIINFKGLTIDSDLETRMKSALMQLYPRGPDQQGQYKDEYSYLVHSRLSIIDISNAARQPINKYGKIIVYNGEIYNYKEIRSKLLILTLKFY